MIQDLTDVPKYHLKCPSCGAVFDCESALHAWKNELFDKIDEIIIELKGGKDEDDKTKRNL